MLDDAFALRAFAAGERFEVGPFAVDTWALPHFVPNAGLRLTGGGRVLAYTGDTGPCPELADLARDADLFLAEATYTDQVPAEDARYLSSARRRARHAARAGAGRLLLTHLWPGTLAGGRRRPPAGRTTGRSRWHATSAQLTTDATSCSPTTFTSDSTARPIQKASSGKAAPERKTFSS